MTLKDFYYFGTQGYMTQFYAPCTSIDKKPVGINWEWELLYGRYDNFDMPVIFQQKPSYGGNKFTDFLNTGYANLYPISDKVLDILIENNITGWKTYPIEVFDKKGNEVPGYHGFSIIGRCKDLDISLLKERVAVQYYESGPIREYYKGFPLDLSTWDGSDIFLLSGTGWSFITKRVYSLFKKHKITNIRYEKVTDHLITDFNREKYYINKDFKNSKYYNL